MDTALLATKLRIPPPAPRTVGRDRLIDAIDHAIPHHKLIMVAAPAGYGKTTLLSQWARASRSPVAWLSLGAEDNDPDRFLRYLLTAWERVQPGIMESPLGVLLSATVPDRDAVLSAFVNVADDLLGPMIFVLDDYHMIGDESIHRALPFLLDHLPPALHFVLACRGEPPVPLARYRARRELREFGVEDLQFGTEETADFLNRLMGLELTHDEIMPLQSQLEGWVAGLQLVALTLQRRHQAAGGSSPVAGSASSPTTWFRRSSLTCPAISAGSCSGPASWRPCAARCATPSPGGRVARRCWSSWNESGCSSCRWTTAESGTAITASLPTSFAAS